MTCQEFHKKLQNFIDNTMEPEAYEGFVQHAHTCHACYDELEIHYMIQIGLERMEQDFSQSLDLKTELANQLAGYQQKAERMFLWKGYLGMIRILAECCALILVAAKILQWF